MTADKKQKAVVLGVVLLVLAVLAIFAMRTAMPPEETKTDFNRVPPKGIGKHDRGKD